MRKGKFISNRNRSEIIDFFDTFLFRRTNKLHKISNVYPVRSFCFSEIQNNSRNYSIFGTINQAVNLTFLYVVFIIF